MADTVLGNMDKKNKEEEDKMRNYLDEKEKKYFFIIDFY